MIRLYLILLLAIVVWKGFWAWKRGMSAYRKDRHDHDSLREYLLGNGATAWEARRPFIQGAETPASAMAIVPVPIGVGRADIPVFIDGQFLMCGKKLKQIRKKSGPR